MASEEPAREEPKMVPQDRLSALLIPLSYIFSVLFILIALFTLFEVIMRYVFNAPTFWVHETTISMSAICFAFGGAFCLGTDRHIRVVLIYDAVGPRVRRWLDVGISLVGMVACALMGWAAYGLARGGLFMPGGQFRIETTGSAWNPPTPGLVKTFLFIVLCVMCVQFALQALRHIRRDPNRDRQSEISEERVAGDV